MFVTSEVADQIYPVDHHQHLYCHNNENHKKISVCLFLSALQTHFKLRGQFGFLFCLFIVCCAVAPVTMFLDARLCQLQSGERVVFMPSKYFHSLEDVFFNSVGWKIKSVKSLIACFSDNIGLKFHGRRDFMYCRV